MGKTFHTSVDVHGVMRWGDADQVLAVVKLAGGPEAALRARGWLQEQLAAGHELVPLGEPCEGFSYETGCPGHPIAGVSS